jgi:hypothetical protein
MTSFDDFLKGRSVHLQATARAVRAFIRSLGADINEQMSKDEATYTRERAFCAIVIERGEVQVRFPDASLPDLHRILRGAGLRSVRLRAPTDFSDAVRAIIRAAYQQAA